MLGLENVKAAAAVVVVVDRQSGFLTKYADHITGKRGTFERRLL